MRTAVPAFVLSRTVWISDVYTDASFADPAAEFRALSCLELFGLR